MKILIYCRYYLPLVGGLPIRMRIMAERFAATGHNVTVVTDTPGSDATDDNIQTYRNVSLLKLRSLARAQDVLLSANISLKAVPVLLSVGRPVFVAHGGGYAGQGKFGCLSRLKLMLTRQVNNIYCSHAVAGWVGTPGVVLPNTYRADVFCEHSGLARTGDIVTFARLVSDKGIALVVEALAKLRSDGHDRTLTIVGDGPEWGRLQALVSDLGLEDYVTFTGERTGPELAATLAVYRVAVLPSLWEEPFGNVALEALGCGCIIITSDGGGLPEAAGQCGLKFTSGNSASLAEALLRSDDVDKDDKVYAARRTAHLNRHHPDSAADAYLAEFQRVLNKATPVSRDRS